MEQMVEEMLWGIAENFYVSFRLFQNHYKDYEQRIKYFCDAKQATVDVVIKNLTREELLTLIDYHQFSKLRDNYLESLQKLSYQFTKITPHTHLLDYYVRDIIYEISVLKDGWYKLQVSAPEYMEFQEEEEYKIILDDVRSSFAVKMIHLSHLFRKTRKELEKLLSHYRESKILVRSLYLFSSDLMSPVYNQDLTPFWQAVFPDYHQLELYSRAAGSFYAAGFSKHAIEAAVKAKDLLALQAKSPYQLPDEWETMIAKILEVHPANAESL